MRPTGKKPSVPQRGFGAIGLLIVLVILLLLGYRQYAAHRSGGASMQKYSMDKANQAACDLNRQSSLLNLLSWQSTHPGQPVTIEQLRAQNVQMSSCPAGGIWTISPDGTTIYCSIHHPAPEPASAVTPAQ